MSNHVVVDLHLILDYFGFTGEVKGKERLICCPFHNEKTPSLYANKDKGVWKCFGCGEKGNGIQFIEKYRSIPEKEAFKFYCEIAGITYHKESKIVKTEEYYNSLSIPEQIIRSSTLLTEPTEYLKSRSIDKITNKNIYILQKDFYAQYQDKEIKIYKNAYIIPIFNKNNELKSIQYITPNNIKNFLTAHPVKNGFCKFFINNNERFFLVEGVWDALSLNIAGFNAICCFNKDNLVACALDNFENWIYKGFVFADNEPQGIEKAVKCSAILNTEVIKSPTTSLKDVNDILKLHGTKYLWKYVNDFLEGNYLSSLNSLIKSKKLSIFYSKNSDKYIAYLFKERFINTSKTKVGLQILNKLIKEKIIWSKSTNIDRQSEEIGKFLASNYEAIDDENYHPKYKYFEVYNDNGKKYLNTYYPSGLHAQEKLVRKPFKTIYEHLVHICGTVEYADWFLEFLAWKWQKPWDTKIKIVLPIFHGQEGTGKSTVKELLGILFGHNTNMDLSNTDFDSTFNSAFQNKLFCIAEEVITADNRVKAHAKIKALTGSTTFALNDKNEKIKNNYNFFGNIILLSNNEYVYPIGKDDRRAVVFKQLHIPDTAYFNKYYDNLEKEAEGLAYYLANLPLKGSLHRLETTGRADLIEVSKHPVEEFVDDLSINASATIKEINFLFKTEFPFLENKWNTDAEYSGFLIQKDEENKKLLISANMFLAMYNKKYGQKATNNRFIYTSARKNSKFSYETTTDFVVTYNKKTIRVVKIDLN